MYMFFCSPQFSVTTLFDPFYIVHRRRHTTEYESENLLTPDKKTKVRSTLHKLLKLNANQSGARL